ncbi:MAG: hypothetical protein QOE45_304 [Frankiaceae bacterium]|jgi:hypothetical protein|nr:hypothetical protein [Frankiaceae bacterium]
MRARLALVAALVGGVLPLLPAPAHAAGGVMQPGDVISTSTGGCTLNFLFDGIGANAGKVYFATAAHCVSSIGQDVFNGANQAFGDVAYIGNAASTGTDFAFIQVRAGFAVSPAVKGWPQYPTGSTVSTQTTAGDQIQQSGYGTSFSFTKPTQEQRKGVLVSDTATVWRFAGAMDFGDSGGPLVHIPTGKALGIESRVCIGACTDEGPTIEGVLGQTATPFPVALRTV